MQDKLDKLLGIVEEMADFMAQSCEGKFDKWAFQILDSVRELKEGEVDDNGIRDKR